MQNLGSYVRLPWGWFACNKKNHQNLLGIFLKFGRLTNSQNKVLSTSQYHVLYAISLPNPDYEFVRPCTFTLKSQ